MKRITKDYREEQVIRHAFHGFFYNKRTHEIEYSFELNKEDGKALSKVLGGDCHYNDFISVTKKYRRKHLGISHNKLAISQINSGDIITLCGEFEYSLRIVNVRQSHFLCLTDDSGVLCYGDELVLLSMGMGVGMNVLFSVKREGRSYPDSQRVFQFPLVRKLYLMPGVTLYDKNASLPPPIHTFQVLYAYGFATWNGEPYLSGANLTTDNSAVIQVNLSNKTFTINLCFRSEYYNDSGINIVDDILRPISCVKGRNIKDIKDVQEGTFHYDKDRNVLRVVRKMEIILGK